MDRPFVTGLAKTFWVKLFMSGPIEVAKQLIREDCQRAGLCVTIEPTTFIYTGGEEAGYVVGLINYPKYSSTQKKLVSRARELLQRLIEGTHQDSGLMMTPEVTEWVSRRPAVNTVSPVPLVASDVPRQYTSRCVELIDINTGWLSGDQKVTTRQCKREGTVSDGCGSMLCQWHANKRDLAKTRDTLDRFTTPKTALKRKNK